MPFASASAVSSTVPRSVTRALAWGSSPSACTKRLARGSAAMFFVCSASALNTRIGSPLAGKADVGLRLDSLGLCRRPEARPAGAGLVLLVGAEKQLAAAGAVIASLFLAVLVFAREGALGALLAQHVVLRGRELLAPLGLGLL